MAKRETERADPQEPGEPLAHEAAKPAAATKHVKMRRSEPVHKGGPVTAEVHPAEVDNWIAGGWRRAE